MYYNGTYKNDYSRVSLCGVLVRALDFKTGGLGSIPTIGKIFFFIFLFPSFFMNANLCFLVVHYQSKSLISSLIFKS